MIENDDCAGLCDPTENEFFKFFKNLFFSFCGVFCFIVNRYTSRKSTERKRQIPNSQKESRECDGEKWMGQKLFLFGLAS